MGVIQPALTQSWKTTTNNRSLPANVHPKQSRVTAAGDFPNPSITPTLWPHEYHHQLD